MHKSVLAAVICLSIAGQAPVDAAQTAERKSIDIAAQPLEQALQALAKSSEIRLIYKTEMVDRLNSKGASGALTTMEALAHILSGTGLTYRFIDDRTVTLVPAAAFGQSAAAAGINLAQAASGASENHDTDSGAGEQSESSSKAATADETSSSSKGIPEILVKGSRGEFSLNADIQRSEDDIQPYVVFDRETIQSSGAVNIEDLLKQRLTMNYSPDLGNFAQGQAVIGRGNTSNIALRGLDSTQTLILIDGRRSVSSSSRGFNAQPDINAIPLNAIERIEVLPATASGIYGGGAVGGVVNIVLRRDYSGLDTVLSYESSFRSDGGARRVDVNAGHSFFGGRTSVLFSGSYSGSTGIRTADRAFIARYEQRTADRVASFGIPDYRLGSATNVVSADEITNLVLKDGTPLNSIVTSAPAGYLGIQSDDGAALAGNAGRINSGAAQTAQNREALAQLAGDPIVKSADFTLRQKLGETLELFLEASASRNDAFFDLTSTSAFYVLEPEDLGNPFRQEVFVQMPVYSDDVTNTTKVSNRRALFGIKGQLGNAWYGQFDYSVSRFGLLTSSLAPSELNESLATDLATGRVDAFRDDSSARVIQQYLFKRLNLTPTHSTANDISFRVAGPIIELPAGPVNLSLMNEWRDEKNSESTIASPRSDGTYSFIRHSEQGSKNYGAYFEVTTPVVSQAQHIPGIHLLDVQLAARYDRYDQQAGFVIGPGSPAEAPKNSWHSVNPTFGARFSPIKDLTFRASYGTGFQPPALGNFIANPPRQVTSGLLDPKRGNARIGVITYFSGGNPDLKPEDSISKSIGLILTPSAVKNFRASFDWTQIDKRNNVTSLSLTQEVINSEESIPGIIGRASSASGVCNPVCPIVSFNSALINNAHAMTESYDMSVDYKIEAGRYGAFALTAIGTRLLHASSQITSLAPYVDRAGQPSYPTWNMTGSLGWEWQSLFLAWNARYFGSYWLNLQHAENEILGASKIGSVIYHDVSLRYLIDSPAVSSRLKDIELRAGIKNVFDKPPRYTTLSLYDYWGSPLLRAYYLSVKKSF